MNKMLIFMIVVVAAYLFKKRKMHELSTERDVLSREVTAKRDCCLHLKDQKCCNFLDAHDIKY